ncbi:MAG: DNA primase [Firmicutes bacterium]|nr:DNA primase [Bacillota bacterium]MCL2255664.1 DNA primase [Bacillota bacterium]
MDFYSELTAKLNITDVVGDYIELKKKGNTFWGCCPFHIEKTPSFSVSSDKNLFHCFGCKESGNMITFIKKIETVEYREALEILARKAGLEVPTNFNIPEGKKVDKDKVERLLNLMRDAAYFYHENLKNERAKPALAYLEKRGIDYSLVRKFGLGVSIDGMGVINHLLEKSYTREEMKEAGLIAVRDNENAKNDHYDVFYSRLMFPIIDAQGKVRGFGGRALKDGDFAKYRNSSQGIIFDKSNTIYGINLLQKHKREHGKVDYIIVTEGYMDTIMLNKAGFPTTVASMGTAFTFQQAKKLKDYSDKVFVSFDGDVAGQKAALRGLDILREAKLDVRVVVMPEGLDPDDVVNKHGVEAYKKLLKDAKTITAYKIDILKGNYNLSDPIEKSRFVVDAIKAIKQQHENPVEIDEYLVELNKQTNYSIETLRRQAEVEVKDEVSYAPLKQYVPLEKRTKYEKAKSFVLSSYFNECGYVDKHEEDFAEIFYDIGGNLYDGEEKDSLQNYIKDIPLVDATKEYSDCLKLLKTTYYEMQKEELMIKEDGESQRKYREYQEKINNLKKS